MRLIVLVLISFLLKVLGLELCTDESSIFQNVNIRLNQDKNNKYLVKFNIDFDIYENIYNGSVNIQTKFNNKIIFLQDYNLCEILDNDGYDCPLEIGYHNLNWENELPKDAKSGDYYYKEVWTNEDFNNILCFKYIIKI